MNRMPTNGAVGRHGGQTLSTARRASRGGTVSELEAGGGLQCRDSTAGGLERGRGGRRPPLRLACWEGVGAPVGRGVLREEAARDWSTVGR